MQITTLVPVYAFLLILAGCGSNSDNGNNNSNNGTDNTVTPLPKTTVLTLDSGGELSRHFVNSPNGQREYSLYSPNNPEREKLPLVIWLHGAGGNVWTSIQGDFWLELAEQEQFHFLAPQAITDGAVPYVYWNAGFPNSSLLDGLFIKTALEAVVDEKEIDTDKIYVAGMSSGANMVFVMARALQDEVAAIAPISGLVSSSIFPGYSLEKPMPLCYIYGSADSVVPASGNDLLEPWSNIKSFWLDNNGIASDAVIKDFPDTYANDGSTVTKFEYRGATISNDIDIFLINNGSHSVPGIEPSANQDINSYQVIWDFFKEHKLTDPY